MAAVSYCSYLVSGASRPGKKPCRTAALLSKPSTKANLKMADPHKRLGRESSRQLLRRCYLHQLRRVPAAAGPLPVSRKSETIQLWCINRSLPRSQGGVPRLPAPPVRIGTELSDTLSLECREGRFSLLVEDEVYYRYNSEKSFGANSFFVRHPDGNWLIDSPRYLKPLVEAFDRMGGIAYIFLTHEDDGRCRQIRAAIRAKRIIHRADAHAMPDAEVIIDGSHAQSYGDMFEIIPVPAIRQAASVFSTGTGSYLQATISGGIPRPLELNAPAAVGVERGRVARIDRDLGILSRLNGYCPVMEDGYACLSKRCVQRSTT